VTRPGAIEDLLRELAPQVLITLVRRYGDFAGAEDAVQDALIAAAQQWTTSGVPAHARGWLLTVATRRLTDMWRANAARHKREVLASQREPATPAEASDMDDSLALLFLCCHPALTPAYAIPLTLRAVGGLTTAEIARAFLLPEPTIGKRISRAKQRIAESALPLRMPEPDEMPQRLRTVMHVLYLMFNEGYAATSGPAVSRTDLTAEAIRLARMLHTAMPDEPEASGLLALMLLTEARRPARTGPHGELIPLDEQVRTLWDKDLITEGTALINTALRQQRAGYYQLQAAIAAIHDEATTTNDTDWRQILAIYELLARISTNPMVQLNLAIAAAMVHGPETALAMLQPLETELAENHRLDAVRGHLLEMAGHHAEAARCYTRAAERTTSEAEQNYRRRRAARLRPQTP
jgi:RNA polymerase sigma factor (sigma-70 family)